MLTGSKNALKGVGFFLGAVLLELVEFRGALLILENSGAPKISRKYPTST